MTDPIQAFDSSAVPAPDSDLQISTTRCGQCGQTMRVMLVAPLLVARNCDEVTYGCDACGAELRRVVNRG